MILYDNIYLGIFIYRRYVHVQFNFFKITCTEGTSIYLSRTHKHLPSTMSPSRKIYLLNMECKVCCIFFGVGIESFFDDSNTLRLLRTRPE